jgi:hypothetical protein
VREIEVAPGAPVLVYLHSPREKFFGVLLSLEPAGVAVRGLDLVSLEDWIRQEARGDTPGISPASVFYPMARVERVERDETVGEIEGLSDRFRRLTGRNVLEVSGFRIPEGPR